MFETFRQTAGTTLIATQNILGGNPFTLSQIDGFPHADFTARRAEYEERESWFTGDGLDVYIEDNLSGKKLEKYPVKVNPITGACLKHAYALFGEYADDQPGALVQFQVDASAKGDKETAREVEEILAQMWFDSQGGAQMMENAILSQEYGGCVFRVAYTPDNPQNPEESFSFPYAIERINPKEFYGIPYSNNPWRLREAWIIREITPDTAAQYGLTEYMMGAYYIEYWSETQYYAKINSQPISYVLLGEIKEYAGPNPFKIVPFVYIPHTRAGGFWGTSLISDAMISLVKEEAARIADVGDATNEESHGILAMRNVQGMPSYAKLPDGQKVLNLGSVRGITSNESQPDLFVVKRSQAQQVMMELVRELHKFFRREASLPGVADGEDEGSQRSALTLTTRMWPLVAHAKQERVFWSTGLAVLNRIALHMMATKGHFAITKEMAKLRVKTKWFPILPRDREQLLNEVVNRIVNGLGSPKHLLKMLGDVEDVDQEYEDILEFMEEKSKRATKAFSRPQQPGKPGESPAQQQAIATQAKGGDNGS